MTAPTRKLIMDDIFASLGAISEGAEVPYNTTAQTVERRIISPDEVPVRAPSGEPGTPWFGVIPNGVERLKYEPGGMLWKVLPVLVAGAVAIPPNGDQTEDGRALVVANLLEDIRYALSGTGTLSERGGNAVHTLILEQWGDEAHETPVSVEGDYVIAWCAVRAEVAYQQSRSRT